MKADELIEILDSDARSEAVLNYSIYHGRDAEPLPLHAAGRARRRGQRRIRSRIFQGYKVLFHAGAGAAHALRSRPRGRLPRARPRLRALLPGAAPSQGPLPRLPVRRRDRRAALRPRPRRHATRQPCSRTIAAFRQLGRTRSSIPPRAQRGVSARARCATSICRSLVPASGAEVTLPVPVQGAIVGARGWGRWSLRTGADEAALQDRKWRHRCHSLATSSSRPSARYWQTGAVGEALGRLGGPLHRGRRLRRARARQPARAARRSATGSSRSWRSTARSTPPTSGTSVDPDAGRVIVYMQNRRDHPRGEGVIDFPGVTILDYAGNGQWKREEDFWAVPRATQALRGIRRRLQGVRPRPPRQDGHGATGATDPPGRRARARTPESPIPAPYYSWRCVRVRCSVRCVRVDRNHCHCRESPPERGMAVELTAPQSRMNLGFRPAWRRHVEGNTSIGDDAVRRVYGVLSTSLNEALVEMRQALERHAALLPKGRIADVDGAARRVRPPPRAHRAVRRGEGRQSRRCSTRSPAPKLSPVAFDPLTSIPRAHHLRHVRPCGRSAATGLESRRRPHAAHARRRARRVRGGDRDRRRPAAARRAGRPRSTRPASAATSASTRSAPTPCARSTPSCWSCATRRCTRRCTRRLMEGLQARHRQAVHRVEPRRRLRRAERPTERARARREAARGRRRRARALSGRRARGVSRRAGAATTTRSPPAVSPEFTAALGRFASSDKRQVAALRGKRAKRARAMDQLKAQRPAGQERRRRIARRQARARPASACRRRGTPADATRRRGARADSPSSRAAAPTGGQQRAAAVGASGRDAAAGGCSAARRRPGCRSGAASPSCSPRCGRLRGLRRELRG